MRLWWWRKRQKEQPDYANKNKVVPMQKRDRELRPAKIVYVAGERFYVRPMRERFTFDEPEDHN